jgi:hypothetical protein
MREFTYKLKELVNEEKNPFSGTVVLKLPKFTERNVLLREISFKRDQVNEADVTTNLEVLEKLVKIVQDHVLKVDVKKGEKQFLTLDELEYDFHFSLFVLDVGMVIVQGIDLGNV